MQFAECLNPTGRSRRSFFQAAATSAFFLAPVAQSADIGNNVLGPMPGYSPQIGTLVSEMTWMRGAVLSAVDKMTRAQLDFLLDNKANRIGALLLHLAATEKLYQLNTFEQVGAKQLDSSPAFKTWKVAMDLGEPARHTIKDHDLDYYLNLLKEGREKTLMEFRKRDDKWLLSVDKEFPWGPTDNLCKWFHVCEHESHHTGQISLLKTRVPGAKPENG
jgi:uncharacterized damage-inducible protein DinB